MDKATERRRLEATMRHHEKMARMFRLYGNERDAKHADTAARILRERLAGKCPATGEAHAWTWAYDAGDAQICDDCGEDRPLP